MEPIYEHTQSGRPLLRLLVPAIGVPVVLLFTSSEEDRAARALLVAVLGLVGVSGWTFSSLTVRVDPDRLEWSFGPGLLRKSVQVGDIERVEPVRTTVLNGWGIHLTRRGWLYNVSGFEAVWVRLRGGRQFLLGTDEPHVLCDAIDRASGRGRASNPESGGGAQ